MVFFLIYYKEISINISHIHFVHNHCVTKPLQFWLQIAIPKNVCSAPLCVCIYVAHDGVNIRAHFYYIHNICGLSILFIFCIYFIIFFLGNFIQGTSIQFFIIYTHI